MSSVGCIREGDTSWPWAGKAEKPGSGKAQNTRAPTPGGNEKVGKTDHFNEVMATSWSCVRKSEKPSSGKPQNTKSPPASGIEKGDETDHFDEVLAPSVCCAPNSGKPCTGDLLNHNTPILYTSDAVCNWRCGRPRRGLTS